jgi:hypothetical protein
MSNYVEQINNNQIRTISNNGSDNIHGYYNQCMLISILDYLRYVTKQVSETTNIEDFRNINNINESKWSKYEEFNYENQSQQDILREIARKYDLTLNFKYLNQDKRGGDYIGNIAYTIGSGVQIVPILAFGDHFQLIIENENILSSNVINTKLSKQYKAHYFNQDTKQYEELDNITDDTKKYSQEFEIYGTLIQDLQSRLKGQDEKQVDEQIKLAKLSLDSTKINDLLNIKNQFIKLNSHIIEYNKLATKIDASYIKEIDTELSTAKAELDTELSTAKAELDKTPKDKTELEKRIKNLKNKKTTISKATLQESKLQESKLNNRITNLTSELSKKTNLQIDPLVNDDYKTTNNKNYYKVHLHNEINAMNTELTDLNNKKITIDTEQNKLNDDLTKLSSGFKQKYLKYKQKYVDLKYKQKYVDLKYTNQKGGSSYEKEEDMFTQAIQESLKERKDLPSNECKEQAARINDYTYIHIVRDGNCLYSCIARHMNKIHTIVRKEITDYIDMNRSHFAHSVEAGTIDEYLYKQRTLGEYGDYIIILAAASLYNIHILVYTMNYNKERKTCSLIPPVEEYNITRNIVTNQEIISPSKSPLRLSHESYLGLHYGYLESVNTSSSRPKPLTPSSGPDTSNASTTYSGSNASTASNANSGHIVSKASNANSGHIVSKASTASTASTAFSRPNSSIAFSRPNSSIAFSRPNASSGHTVSKASKASSEPNDSQKIIEQIQKLNDELNDINDEIKNKIPKNPGYYAYLERHKREIENKINELLQLLDSSFEQKYLKYKQKYLQLKNI